MLPFCFFFFTKKKTERETFQRLTFFRSSCHNKTKSYLSLFHKIWDENRSREGYHSDWKVWGGGGIWMSFDPFMLFCVTTPNGEWLGKHQSRGNQKPLSLMILPPFTLIQFCFNELHHDGSHKERREIFIRAKILNLLMRRQFTPTYTLKSF